MMLGVPVAVRARDVPEATPMLGVIKVGEVEKTILVLAVPVVPVAEVR